MAYSSMNLKDIIAVEDIISIHYFEFSPDYTFSGEQHDFWEFVYVDCGSAIVTAGDKAFFLEQGDCFFHPPGQWHNLNANRINASNVVVISFLCDTPDEFPFSDKILRLDAHEKLLISNIIKESTHVFSTPLGNPHTKEFYKRDKIPLGAEQLIRLYLTQFLILMLRRSETPVRRKSSPNSDDKLFSTIECYLKQNLSRKLTLDDLSHYTNVSKSTIKQLFKKEVNMGAIQYFIHLKMETAKTYLRESQYNITQIAELLGYDNIHYFSRQFKKFVGFSPTAYLQSIKAIIDKS